MLEKKVVYYLFFFKLVLLNGKLKLWKSFVNIA